MPNSRLSKTLSEHAVTSIYIAVIVTIILILQIIEALN